MLSFPPITNRPASHAIYYWWWFKTYLNNKLGQDKWVPLELLKSTAGYNLPTLIF